MNYKFVYDSIVLKAQNRTEELEYYENHHILPKSLGGSNDKTNLVIDSKRTLYMSLAFSQDVCCWNL